MRNVVIDGPDLTLKTPTAFSCGFMHDPADPATGRKLRHLFGSGGFGHAGAGGSHAFADPAHGLSFGYAMNRMDLNVLPGVKTRNLISAVMESGLNLSPGYLFNSIGSFRIVYSFLFLRPFLI